MVAGLLGRWGAFTMKKMKEHGYIAFVPLNGNEELLWALEKLGVNLTPNFRTCQCKWCFESFIHKRLGAKFCSDACNTASLRAKRKKKANMKSPAQVLLDGIYNESSS